MLGPSWGQLGDVVAAVSQRNVTRLRCSEHIFNRFWQREKQWDRFGWWQYLAQLEKRPVMVWIAATLLSLCICQVSIPRPDFSNAEEPVKTRINQAAAAVQSEPNSARRWGEYAITLHAHSYDKEADVAYGEAQRLEPDEFKWPYFRGVLFEKSEFARALELIDLAISLDPSYGPAHDRRGMILQGGLGRESDAEQAFREAVRLLPGSPSANLHLGQIELKRGEFESAIRHFETARQRWPDDSSVLSSLAMAYARQGARDKARQLADAARNGRRMPAVTDPRLNEVADADVKLSSCLNRAGIYQRAKQTARAVAELEKARQLGHDPGRLDEALANVYLTAGEFKKVVATGQKAVSAGRKTAELYHSIGSALLALRRLDEAERLANTGLELSTADPKLLRLLGQIASLRGQDEDAIRFFDQSLEKENEPGTRRLRARSLMRLGQNEEAIAELKQICTSPSANWLAWLTLGEAHVQLTQYEEALSAFQQAEKGATVPLPGRSVVFVLIAQKEFTQAERKLRELLKRWPQNPNLASDLAWLLSTCPDELVRDGTAALALIEPVIRRTQRRVHPFLNTYAAALAENGRFDEALAAIADAIQLLPAAATSDREAYSKRRGAYLKKQPWRLE